MKPLHFSALKRMALSPAHFLAAQNEEYENTKAMRIGTIVHHIVCGPHKTRPLARWEGERRGVDWKRFEADQAPGTEIVTAPEWSEAAPIAQAVYTNPLAKQLLNGARREVQLSWKMSGVECETDGVDILGPDYFADLKTTTCTEPASFSRHAFKLLYHAQMAWLREGLRANGHPAAMAYLIGVETSPPYAVTVLRLPEPVMAMGAESVAMWLERYRACAAADAWPAYTQAIVDFELPAWVGGDDE